MNRRPRFVITLLGISTIVGVAGCATQEREDTAVRLQASAILNGKLAGAADAPHTLLLRGGEITCTGIAISAAHIVTAAHCLPTRATVVSYEVYSGPDATDCVSDDEQSCAPITFDVRRHQNADLAILSARRRLVGFEPETLPLLHAGGGKLSSFNGLGYGAGSYVDAAGQTVMSAVASHLLTGEFTVDSAAERLFTTHAPAGRAAACMGDSGGPALVRLSSGEEALVGTLLYSDSGEKCTLEDGTDTWLRIEAFLPFIEAIVGKCPRTNDGPWVLADCRGAPPATVGATLDPDMDSPFEAVLEMPGIKKIESGIDLKTAPETVDKDSTGPVVIAATSKGNYRVTFDPAELDAAVGDMFGGKRAPPGSSIVRGWSDGVDNRIKLPASGPVPEMGELSTTFDIDSQHVSIGCTGTLIGHRIVRTSAHCVIYIPLPAA